MCVFFKIVDKCPCAISQSGLNSQSHLSRFSIVRRFCGSYLSHYQQYLYFLKWDSLFFLRREIWRLFFISRTFPRSDSVSFPPFENSPNFFSFITGQSIPADVFFFNPLERQCCLRSSQRRFLLEFNFFYLF